jgi:cyclopropane fatty-acyl-phospholipid synthase-like methyltransferase
MTTTGQRPSGGWAKPAQRVAATPPGTVADPADRPHGHPRVTERVERLVIGADFGADGYTTLDQADELADRLALRPGQRLLDLGTGSGWPGVYLAKKTGCQVLLTDLPGPGLRTAVARAGREQVAGRCAAVASEGPRLPFATAAFDAVLHADVLCCLRAKRATLMSCRRILRPHGRMAFFAIFVAPALTARDHRRALQCGPPALATPSTYRRLLDTAGFLAIDEVDVTDAYLDTARRWLCHQREFAAELAPLQPPGAFDQRLRRRRAAIAAIEAGLLRRSLLVVKR